MTSLTVALALLVPRLLRELVFDTTTIGIAAVCVLGPLLIPAYVCAFLDWLAGRGVWRAVLSRNMREAVIKVLDRCGVSFDPVLARFAARLTVSDTPALFEVSATDPAIYLAVAGLLGGVALAAGALPAARASRVDPASALRCE